MLTEFAKKQAILIGVNSYTKVKALDFCRDDVLALSDTLRNSLGFEDENILTFVEDSPHPPNKAEIFDCLGRIVEAKSVGEDDLLIFFFSGHGMIGKDGKDYLLPIEVTPFNLKESAINMESVIEELKRTGCKNIVMFVDACREPIPGTKGVISIGDDSKEALGRAGIVTFFSCDPKDKSYEIPQLKHGSFTYCILDAISKGEANTVAALDAYLRKQVPVINEKHGKPAQQPYAVIEPAEKAQLPIFYTVAREAKTGASIDEWLTIIGDKFEDGKLSIDLFNKIVVYLDRREGNFEQDRRTMLIHQLCSGELDPVSFRVAWDAHANRKARTKTSL